MSEPLTPPERAQLERLGGISSTCGCELRPTLMVDTSHPLQDAGVEPDVWKIEGLDQREDPEKAVDPW